MDGDKLKGMIERVRTGRLSRRRFVGRMLAVGLTAPMATQLLSLGGVAMAQPATGYKPTKRGGGGALKLLWWQGPTLLNPHFATGTKDQDGSRMFYEPLASWAPDGSLVPILAAEIPTRANGGLAADGKSVTWKLKQGVKWHDGQPFTADDVVFNWEYAKDPATAAVSSGQFKDIVVEKIDTHTVKISFPVAKPFWAEAFVSSNSTIIPKHLFAAYTGAKSREAPTNLVPVGTGPYLFKEFRPGDLLTGVINPNYHMANKPHFDSVEMKGGGDAVSAARAVLQTGEYDFAWNLQVEDEVLLRLEKGGKGRVALALTANIEHVQLNTTDPNTEVDGERSSLKTVHPAFSDKAVREAMALLIDRESVEKYIYGRTGIATGNYLNNPPPYVSKNTSKEFNIDKANAILDKAGWAKGADGIRAKGGKQLKFLFQTSINQPRQKTQAIIKQSCQKAGIELEIKAVAASVFFSSDVANPDTYPHFYADMQMYTTGPNAPDPGIWMQSYLSNEAATKANKWQGRNITRWRSPEWDKLYATAEAELDPIKRAAMYITLNDMPVKDQAIIPVVYRPSVAAASNKLNFRFSGWDSYIAEYQDWFMEA